MTSTFEAASAAPGNRTAALRRSSPPQQDPPPSGGELVACSHPDGCGGGTHSFSSEKFTASMIVYCAGSVTGEP